MCRFMAIGCLVLLCSSTSRAAFDDAAASDGGEENNFFCEPTLDRLSCEGQCGAPGSMVCSPQEILTDFAGNFLEVTCCACEEKECYLRVDPVSQEYFCEAPCLDANVECRLVGQGNPDGTITYSCDCVNPNEPVECEFIDDCNPNCPGTCAARCTGICPRVDDACLPSVIVESPPFSGNFVVSDCDCDMPVTDLCRPVLVEDPAGMGEIVDCIGDCPNPDEECRLLVSDIPNGLQYECDPCPTIDPHGACCYVDAVGDIQCADATEDECESIFNGDYLGDGTNCTVHGYLCDQVIEKEGACCYIDHQGVDQCIVTTQSNCEHVLFGLYQGDNTICDDEICDNNPFVGACCYIDHLGNPQCGLATFEECESILFGTYLGDGTDCDPNPCTEAECDCDGECHDATPQYPDPAYATFTGEVAVVTNFADLPGETVLTHIDVKNRNTAPIGVNWAAATATRYSHASWTRTNLGTIFGVALDRRGHTYVATTTCYSQDYLGGTGTWGSVYKIHAVTGAISVFANLPNTGPGLGNITYDGARDQFFVTNHEDGRIYRLDNTGACLGTFDHATGTISAGCAPEGGDVPGFVPLRERIWGVAVYNNRVYYSVWVEDAGRPDSFANNQVWSIGLSGGTFSGIAQLEITVPNLSFYQWSMPISDISFAETGCMLLAERSMFSDSGPSAHQARVLEYRLAGSGAWWPSSYTFGIGEISFGSTNAAGGVDYDREGHVWATGDALSFSPLVIYGLQSLPCNGGLVTDSVLVDIDAIYNTLDKTEIGDVEIACAERCVDPPPNMVGWWPFDEAAGGVAQDILWANNGTYVGTTPIAGMVAGARNFDGVNDTVRVADHPVLDVGTGDFSVDAWVRTTDAAGVDVICEKREGPGTRGWSFFLFNGALSAQLADGTHTNWVSTLFVADGLWHHVTMTVDRDDPNGLTLYVDGASQTFNPTGRAGNLSTSTNLWIGSREPAFGQIFFRGDIDELEIFRRELTTAEVNGLYGAGRGGKCKDHCHLPPYASMCINQNTKLVNLTICNDSPVGHNYVWFAFGTNDCDVFGPTTFSPSFGFVFVPGETCVNVPITVTRPAGLVVPLVGCYNVASFNLDTGHFFQCMGGVKAIPFWCFKPIEWEPIFNGGLLKDRPKTMGYEITNLESPDGILDYELHAVRHGGGDGTPPPISLDGLPPGEPVVRSVKIPPGGSIDATASVKVLDHEPFVFYDIILMIDSDNDGNAEPHDSTGLFSVLPCGDHDNSGEVDLPDVSILATCMAGPNVEQDAACPEDVEVDCDNDGDADLGDYAKLQNSFGLSTGP